MSFTVKLGPAERSRRVSGFRRAWRAGFRRATVLLAVFGAALFALFATLFVFVAFFFAAIVDPPAYGA